MRYLGMGGLVVLLGLMVPGARAGEGNAPAVSLGRPVAAGGESPAAVPAASLARPLADGARTDPHVRATSYSTPDVGPAPVFRGQSPDAMLSRPMPVGPSATDGPIGLHTWRRPETDSGPEPQPIPTAPAPTPVQSSSSPFGSFGSLFAPDPGCADGVDCPCDATCCAGPCFGCGGNRFYITTEYLLWWMKGTGLPPLVTQGSTADAIPGALGQPGTTVLFGGDGNDTRLESGGRFTVGYWFTENHGLGIEGDYFFLGSRNRSFSDTSMGTPLLGRPFINALTGMETVEIVAAPGALAGTVAVASKSSFWGTDLNLRSTLLCCPHFHFDLLAGFRALGLDDNLDISENLLVLRAPGGNFLISDHFGTQNRFYGAQVGGVSEFRFGDWGIDVSAKLAMGTTQQIVDVNGATVITDPVNGTRTFPGGLLTQTTNIGHYSRDRFTVVPEVGLNLSYQFTPRIRGFVGYNFLYWSSVARVGNQIDRTVNPNLLAPPNGQGGPARPAFPFNGTDFWAQGINFGLEFKF